MKKKKYFGTDGIRGKVNVHPITPDFFFKLGKSINIFSNKKANKQIFIGRDTRQSGQILEDSLLRAFSSDGFECHLLGVVSTPIVSFMTKFFSADFGLMISASHNQYYDNGVKVFKKNGEKLSDNEELILEEIIDNLYKEKEIQTSKTIRKQNNIVAYYNKILSTVRSDLSLSNIKVVIDCANGSLSNIAPEIFSKIGLNFVTMNNYPDGKNINNQCGSLFPEFLSKDVLQNKADLGIAFDGDGDRLIISDENGEIINGDKIMAITCRSMLRQNKLKGNGIVATHMSNIGLEDFLSTEKIGLYRSDVGDKYVVEMMKKKKCNFGGEQSGHFIFSDYSFTGDALLSALQILSILEIENKSINEHLKNYQTFPQILENLKISKDPEIILQNIKLYEYINQIKKKKIKNHLMILVRKSGTEKLIRVMVQSRCNKLTNSVKNDIINIILETDQLCQRV